MSPGFFLDIMRCRTILAISRRPATDSPVDGSPGHRELAAPGRPVFRGMAQRLAGSLDRWSLGRRSGGGVGLPSCRASAALGRPVAKSSQHKNVASRGRWDFGVPGRPVAGSLDGEFAGSMDYRVCVAGSPTRDLASLGLCTPLKAKGLQRLAFGRKAVQSSIITCRPHAST